MQKLAVLHLSDIHIKVGNNPILGRIDQIVNAVAAYAHEIDQTLLVISGDVAFSGKQEEYTIAIELIKRLREEFAKTPLKLLSEFVIIPGNHDCLLTGTNSIRDMFLSNTKKNREHLGADMLEACLKPQANYRNFVGSIQPELQKSNNALFNSRILDVGERKIVINTCNTAWLSRIPEPQGSIFIPGELVQVKSDPQADVCLTVLHHPYNWFEAINAREFRAKIEETSDIIITGHEHEGGSFRRETAETDKNDYIEGHALQDSYDKGNSGFNVIILDFAERSFRTCSYKWTGHFYSVNGAPELRQFSNHSRRLVGTFDPSDRFKSFLDDPGARYSHPRVGYVTLDQIFVAPDFREISETESPKVTHNSQVQGKVAFAAISSHERLLITGPEKSGRTCLAKRVCSRLLKDARVPIFVATSKEPRSVNEAGIDQLLEQVFSEQYPRKLWEQYTQLPRDRRAIVLDDFHLANINRKGKAALLKRLIAQFGKVVILGDESLRLEDISSRSREGALFDGYTEYQILEFGRVLRDVVINKWITLGQETELRDSERDAKHKAYSHAIDTVLGKNLIPAHPIFILVILQQLEASTHHQTNNGSYGYFYEYLITQSLTGKTPSEIDLKYNFLSEFAWLLHSNEKRTLTAPEYLAFAQDYSRDYKIHVSGEQMLGELTTAGIFSKNESGDIQFKYKYYYYYFTARWLAQNLTTTTARQHVRRLAEQIHREEYANIIIFLSYLSKDPYIIDTILEFSTNLYADVPPCDMSAHTRYLNDLQERIPELVCEEMDGTHSREKALHQMDEQDKKEEEEEQEEQIAELLKINRAFKTVDVLGQILKNYAGSMRGDLKIKVARECVAVALRSMNFFLTLVEKNLEGFVDYLVDYYVKQEKISDRVEIVRKAKQLIFVLANSWTVGVIKRLSRAAGSQQLEQIYTELNSEFGTISMSLVDMSVRLDHFSAFPVARIEEVHAATKDNFFADSVLRRLVVTHFYLFPVDFRIRDAICERLDIKIDKSRALDLKTKKLV